MTLDSYEEIIRNRLNTIETPEYDIASEVHERIKTNRGRRKTMKVGLITSICIMLSVGVFAESIPGLSQIIRFLSPETAEMIQTIEKPVENDGIKMEVVGAYNDDEMVVIYITMQDLTEDRLDESLDLYNYSLSEGTFFNAQTIDYDEETKTAVIRVQVNGGRNMNRKTMEFSVSSFLSGKRIFDEVETGISLADIESITPQTMTLNTEDVSGGGGELISQWLEQGTMQILKEGEREITIPDIDFMYITNIGYIDDMLHIQTKWTGEGKDDHGYFYFTDRENNRLDIYPSNIYFGIDELGNTKSRGQHQEYVYDMKDTDLENTLLKGYFVGSGSYTEGDWKVNFKLESATPQREKDIKMDFGDWKADSVQIAQLGITLFGTGEYDHTYAPEILMSMADGTKKQIELTTSFTEDEKITLKYIFDFSLDIEAVESISIDGIVVEF